jgi:hypothetical protein
MGAERELHPKTDAVLLGPPSVLRFLVLGEISTASILALRISTSMMVTGG